MENMSNMSNNYANQILLAIEQYPSFNNICEYNVSQFPADGYKKYHSQLKNGTAILETAEQLNAYLASYGIMHEDKLYSAFDSLFGKEDFNNKTAEIIDWGCGQAFATCVLTDYLKNKKIKLDLSKFILIEPSAIALQRGLEHIDALYNGKQKPEIIAINEKADTSLSIKQHQDNAKIKIHLFSNILDLHDLDLNKVCSNVMTNFDGINYFVCVSPTNGIQLRKFYNMFANSDLLSLNTSNIDSFVFRPSLMGYIIKSISRIEFIFKTNLKKTNL